VNAPRRHARRSSAPAWLLALALAACGDPPLADFAYTPPAGWTTREVAAARSPFPVAVGPARDGVAPTLRVARTRWTGSLLAYVREAERELAEGLDGWRLLANEPFLTDSGQQGLRLLGELPDGSLTLRVAQHVLLEDDTIFVLTATRAAGDDPGTDAAFEQAVRSFVTLPGAAGEVEGG